MGVRLVPVSLALAAAGILAPAVPADKPPKVLVLGSPAPPASPAPGDAPSAAEQARAQSLQGVPVAQVSFVETWVDVRAPGGEWVRLPEGGRVHTGDRLRTGSDSVAQLDFPWMHVRLAPGSELSVSKGTILGLRLEAGRVALASGRDDMIKLETSEAHLRGRGEVVVRREGDATRISVLRGDLRVSAARGAARLVEGFGCVVAPRGACVPRPLPEAPAGLVPGADPVYAAVGEGITLTWRAAPPSARFHVQVLSFDEDDVLFQRDVSEPPYEVAVPWPGLYRWRVSAHAAGLEGPPSLEGLFQVMPPTWLKTPDTRRPK
jgi:hypothetical protein